LKSEEYVPTRNPAARAVTKSRIVGPPSIISANNTIRAVRDVLSERVRL
jgi:hypothetical protein